MFCRYCGREVPEGQSCSCPGAQAAQQAQQQYQQPQQPYQPYQQPRQAAPAGSDVGKAVGDAFKSTPNAAKGLLNDPMGVHVNLPTALVFLGGGLVLYVTIPCVIITNLNGIKIEGIMLLIAFLGFLTNVLMVAYAWFLTRKEPDEKKRDFFRINMSGYSIGPLAVPYIQAFYPTTGLMTAFMFS